jgi:hypothetical protein
VNPVALENLFAIPYFLALNVVWKAGELRHLFDPKAKVKDRGPWRRVEVMLISVLREVYAVVVPQLSHYFPKI